MSLSLAKGLCILRIGGRLQFADLARSQMHPILLHGSHHFTALLIMQTHIRLHYLGVRIVLSELRGNFGYCGLGRQSRRFCTRASRVKSRRTLFGRSGRLLCGPIVTASRPFQVTSIDFAGPLYVKGKPLLKKAISRCLPAQQYTQSTWNSDTFLLALQRFIGCRGKPHTIYTDNAQTFHVSNRELAELWEALSATKAHRLIAQFGITWKFNAPRAGW